MSESLKCVVLVCFLFLNENTHDQVIYKEEMFLWFVVLEAGKSKAGFQLLPSAWQGPS